LGSECYFLVCLFHFPPTFQFPLLGSAELSCIFDEKKEDLSIPLIGFEIPRNRRWTRMINIFQFPLLGSKLNTSKNREKRGLLSIPLIGFFSYISSTSLNPSFFQFPLLGSAIRLYYERLQYFETFNSPYWVL